MIERVAQALYESWNNVPACTASKSWAHLQDALPGQADWFRKIARIAIQNMREPTDAMIWSGGTAFHDLQEDSVGIYQAMIDAALSDGQQGEQK